MNRPISTPLSRRAFLRLAGTASAAALLSGCAPSTEIPSTPESTAVLAPTAAPSPVTPKEALVNVLASGLNFPEGPAFAPDGSLWCTELNGETLFRLTPEGGKRYPVHGRPNGMAFDQQGRAWVTDSGQNAIRRMDPKTEKWETIADKLDGQPLPPPNDLSFDQAGNLLFTCPNFADTQPKGIVCCLRPDGSVKKIVDGFYRPNGLDIVDGGKSLVVADTLRKSLYKGEWDAVAAEWKDPQLWVRVGGAEGPDGMLPGKDGLLYQAIYGDGVILVIDANATILRRIKLPGANPTNVAVDPSGKLGLVVTETEKGQLLSLPEIQPGVAIFDGAAWK